MLEREKNDRERQKFERERGKRRKGLFQLKCERTFQSLVRQSFRLEGLSSEGTLMTKNVEKSSF